MKRIPDLLLLGVLVLTTHIHAQTREDWRTDYEKSGFVSSPRHDATMAYLERLRKASPWISVQRFGVTPQGRDLPLVVLSKDRAFTPAAARRSGRPVVLIQAGIHAGEIDGKDAGLMLLRDIAVTKTLARLADHAIVLFMPIFNLDGHERQSRTNRINQDGPVEQGWRVTAQNLNLNRDYLKADAPEMRAWLGVYNAWLPELLLDCHVTDGIDFQYNLTYSMEMFENAPPPVVRWQRGLRDSFIAGMERQGDPVCPYVFPREDRDLSKGLLTFPAPPRFSTGYAAIRNRAAVLIETHMLKPYKARVTATYRLLVEILSHVNADPRGLTGAVREADDETTRRFSAVADSATFPVAFTSGGGSTPLRFLGYESSLVPSRISGGTYQVWDHRKPVTVTIPLFDDARPSKRVRTPLAYLVPQEWTKAVDVLRAHGLVLERLAEPATVPVETSIFSSPKWREAPYEGRHTLQQKQTPRRETASFPAGTYVLRLAQPAAQAAVHLLEPDAPDSFVSWGFFDGVFEQKEYFEDYMMEDVAVQMLASDTALKTAFETRLATDTAFAKNGRARLNYFYERSPYADARLNVYPVARYFGEGALRAVPESAYRRGGVKR
ncbi:MAG: M14 family metallopeptidase [Ignavibacteria bacterium]|nr:M14 family metallopeptidase [Ignavibacteria bacterium]